MKYSFLFLIFIPFAAFSKEIAADKAVFRVSEEIVFLTDIKEIGEDIERIRCLKTDGLMLSLLGLDKKTQPKFPDYKKINLQDQTSKDFVQKIIFLKKLSHFIATQNIVFSDELKSQIEKDSCIGMKYSDWSKDLIRFFELEIYLQKRFVDLKGKDTKENFESRLTSAKLFLTSLSQKIPHYVFY